MIIVDASTEARRPLMYATVIGLLVLVPVVVMSGVPGDFFGPLVTAYAVAVVAAMVVALTVTGAHVSVDVGMEATGQEGPHGAGHGPGHSSGGEACHQAHAIGRRGGCGRCLDARCAAVPERFTRCPSFQDRNVQVALEGEPGASRERMTALSTELSQRLRDIPGVEGAPARTSGAP